MSVKVITPPSFEPVTLAEARLWCRVDDSDTTQDAMLQLLIVAMREYAEQLTGRAFVQRTLELRLDSFPDEVELPHSPVQSVSSIYYLNGDGALVAMDASPSTWQEDLTSIPPRVRALRGTSWPSTYDGLGAVRVQYVAGYASANAIPKQVRLWMQMRISTMFENREQLVVGATVQPMQREFVDGLLDGLRIERMFA